MKRIDLLDPDLAEPIFFYVQEHFEDFCLKSVDKDLSPLEYVLFYAFDDFCLWFAGR